MKSPREKELDARIKAEKAAKKRIRDAAPEMLAILKDLPRAWAKGDSDILEAARALLAEVHGR